MKQSSRDDDWPLAVIEDLSSKLFAVSALVNLYLVRKKLLLLAPA